MGALKDMREYGIGNTPIHQVHDFCRQGRLILKLEQFNITGSTKARTAYFLLKHVIRLGQITQGMKVVESTSGNLGLALAALGDELGIGVVCLVDPTISESKIKRLRASGAEVRVVELSGQADYRSARMAKAEQLGREVGWIWPNQYGNDAGMLAHEQTTGPEIWNALQGEVDFVVASVGTGGTLLGIARALKARKQNIKVVAVEPEGSTIFGGQPHDYLSVGSGLHEPSLLLRRYGHCIDYFCKVEDELAIQTCRKISALEPCTVGITAGAAIAVAAQLAATYRDRTVLAVVPDGSDNYPAILDAVQENREFTVPIIFNANDWYHNLSIMGTTT